MMVTNGMKKQKKIVYVTIYKKRGGSNGKREREKEEKFIAMAYHSFNEALRDSFDKSDNDK
jgi:hypothetical protein